ncbi:MAG: Hpt domain-containing protein, partial [Pseudomonadales bacterium]|nr:Hpt domain-containing protein [Pseudomonadales bacterium]
ALQNAEIVVDTSDAAALLEVANDPEVATAAVVTDDSVVEEVAENEAGVVALDIEQADSALNLVESDALVSANFQSEFESEPEIDFEAERHAAAVHDEQSNETDITEVEPAALLPSEPIAEQNFDEEIVGIFIEEATVHIRCLSDYLADLEPAFSDITISHDLQRAFHTLKGSAHMAEMQTMARLTSPLEQIVKDLANYQIAVDADILAILMQAETILLDELQAIAEYKTVHHQRVEGFLADLDALHQQKICTSSSSDDAVQHDKQFEMINEALRCMTALEAINHSLQAQGADSTTTADAPALLDDLSISAAQNNYPELAELASALSAFYQQLLPIQAGPEQFESVADLLEQTFDGLESMLDLIAANQKLLAADDLVARLEDYQFTALDAPGDEADITDAPSDAALGDELLPEQTPEQAAEQAIEASAEQDIELALDETVAVNAEISDGPASELTADNTNKLATVTNDEVLRFAQQFLAADDEMLDIFLEEARELHDELDDLVSLWVAEQGECPNIDAVLRNLHTFKGGARLAELSVMGDLVHDFESLIESQQIKQQYDAAFFAQLDDFQLRLGQLMLVADQPTDSVLSVSESLSHSSLAAQDDEHIHTAESAASNAQPLSSQSELDVDALLQEVSAADPETLEIFTEEAKALVDDLDREIQSWQGSHSNESNASVIDAVKRHLHTLKGGARLSSLSRLGNLCHEYEAFIEQYELTQQFDQSFFDQLSFQQQQLNRGFDALLSYEPEVDTAPDTSLVEPVATQQAFVASQTLVVDQDVALDVNDIETTLQLDLHDIDTELMALFIDEANDQLAGIDASIAELQAQGDFAAAIEEMKRLLHTLKGGARVSGMAEVGDVSHDFETFVINAERDKQLDSPAFIEQVQEYQDNLTGLLKEVERVTELLSSAAKQSISQTSNVVPIRADLDVSVLNTKVSQAAIDVTRSFVESLNKDKAGVSADQIKLSPDQLQSMINLAGENLISRSRVEEVMSEMGFSLDEMDGTVDRIHGQLRRMEIETEAQITSRYEQMEVEGQESFDPLEMDRYSSMQQLSKSLIESASDLDDIAETISGKMRDIETILLQMGRTNNELQEGLMRAQMVPFSRMVPRLRRIVRQVANELGKKIEFTVENAEGELDRTVLDRMIAPLEHMLRNAVDHGIENTSQRVSSGKSEVGNITLSLIREGGEVVLTLADDGAGINIDAVRQKAIERGLLDPNLQLSEQEIAQFVLQAGFSTAEQVTQISGRGVGMDVVHSEIKQMGGLIEIESAAGKGTRFIVRLPFTVSVNRALMVVSGGNTYAIPLNTIDGIVRVSPYELEAYYQPDAPPFEYASQQYNLRYMGELLQQSNGANLEGKTAPLPVILVRSSDYSVAVQVDHLLGSQEVVVKSLGPQFSMVEGLTGATVMGNGDVVVILDMLALIREESQRQRIDRVAEPSLDEVQAEHDRVLKIMVTDDSVTVRKVTSRFLERYGFEVVLAKDGQDAVTQLADMEQLPDLMLLDIEMPRMDGFEVLSRVRRNSAQQHIPIVMITSRTGDKHRERAISLGASRYLGKPFQETEVLRVISELTGAEILEA